MSAESYCHACGMPCGNEYHPYAACLMFKQCGSRDEVEANLAAVAEYGAASERTRVREEWRRVFDEIGAAGQGGTAARLRVELDRICPEESPAQGARRGEVGGITGLGSLVQEPATTLREVQAEVERLRGWLRLIEGGDHPCRDENQLRQWAYEAITLGRLVPGGLS